MAQSITQFLVSIRQLLFHQQWPIKLKVILILSELTTVLNCLVSIYVPLYFQKIGKLFAINDKYISNFLKIWYLRYFLDLESLNHPDNPNPTVDNLIHIVEGQAKEFDWNLILVFVALNVVEGVGALSLITCSQQMLWLPVEQHIKRIIQVEFMQHVHTMSFNWMMDTKISDLMAALERGTDSIVSTVDHILYCVIPTSVNIIIAMVFLLMKFGWLYAFVIGFQIILYSAFTLYVIEKRSALQRAANTAEDLVRHRAMESVRNLETVRGFGNETVEKERYSSSLRKFQSQQIQIDILTNMSKATQQAFVCTGMLICSLLLCSSFAHGDSHFTPGDYALLTAYLGRLNGPINYLAGYYRELRVNIVNAGSMMAYFNQKPEIISSQGAQELQIRYGAIEFRKVSLITDSKKIILDDISFTVAPNTTVALVGTTGSGKTSIARLLLRIVDASTGQILIDGVNVKDVCIQSLRRSVGIIPQDITLFNDTIGNNIRYGKPNASDHEVRLAASLAEIHEKISSFPEGYATIVGERGTCLSGGERQRIAISRAILKDPQVLILDEATSSLDTKTEKRVQENLKHLYRNRTCLVITHNLHSTVNADMILVLENGRIVEKGSHCTLLNLNGQFARMWKHQAKLTKRVS